MRQFGMYMLVIGGFIFGYLAFKYKKQDSYISEEKSEVSEFTYYASADATALFIIGIIETLKKLPILVVKSIFIFISLLLFLLSYLIYQS